MKEIEIKVYLCWKIYILMIIYNTTFHIDKGYEKECLEYFKRTYMPEVSASGFLTNGYLRRIIPTAENEGTSFAVQFHVKNIETLNYWIEKEGRSLQKRVTDLFGNKITGFVTLLEEIEWE